MTVGSLFTRAANWLYKAERHIPAPAFSGAAMASNQIASAAFGVFLCARLGAEAYGTINLARSLFLLLLVATPLGLDVALQKIHFRNEDDRLHRQRLGALAWLRLLAATSAIAVFLLARFGGAAWLEGHVFPYAGFGAILCLTLAALPCATDNAVLGGAYRGAQRPIPSLTATYVLQPTLRMIFVAALLTCLDGARAVVLGALLSWVLAWIFIASNARVAFPPGRLASAEALAEATNMLRFAPIMCLSTLVFTMARTLDGAALGYFATIADVGRYAAVQMVGQFVAIIGASLGQTLGARVAEASRQKDLERLQQMLTENMTLGSLLSAPFCIAVALWGKDIDLVLGPSFVIPPSVFVIAALTQWLMTTTHYASAALTMTGRQMTEFHNNLAALGFQLCATLIFVPAFGIAGAALSTALAVSLINFLRQGQIASMLGAPVANWGLTAPLLVSAAVGLPIWLAGGALGFRAWWLTGLLAAVQTTISLAVLLRFFADEGLRSRIGEIAARLPFPRP